MTLTEIDFNLYLESYDFKYEILESYSALYSYLPKLLINFISSGDIFFSTAIKFT